MGINYNEIIKNLRREDIINLLYTLGADEVIEKEDYLITNTICHNVDGGSMKLYYYFNSNLFCCYTNCDSMNIFKFLEVYYETRGIDYNWYNDIYKVVLNCSNYTCEHKQVEKYNTVREKYRKRESIMLPAYDECVLDSFIKKYPSEWIEEGITERAMDKFNILFSINQNKIIIPHYDVDGRLVGIRGRALNEWEVEMGSKYMPVKVESTLYNHKLSLNLYGLYENKENIKNSGICYVFEGEKSTLKMEDYRNPNCSVACCGSSFNIHQLKLLMKHCAPREIVLCFDNEENPREDKYFYKLYDMCKRYNNYCNFSFIYDTKKLLKLKEAPVDEGEEVFNILLERRVKVR